MLLNEYPPLLVVCLLKFIIGIVRMIGLEPTRLSSPDPKSGVATNYTTSAKTDDTKVREVYELGNKKLFF